MALLLCLALLSPWADPVGAQEGRTEAGGGPTTGPEAVLESPLQEQLRRRVESASDASALAVGSHAVRAVEILPLFYERRAYRPAWVTEQGPRPEADELLAELGGARREGLRPEDYHLEAVESLLRRVRAPGPVHAEEPREGPPGASEEGDTGNGALVDLELLLTDAFLTYGSHLLHGRVDPETLQTEDPPARRAPDLSVVLEAALETGDVATALSSLVPPQPGYRARW